MPPHHHFNLRMILRSANERYRVIAETFRESLRLSHHARKLAQAKGLKINTNKASRCPQKLVSVLPLHEIDFTASPTANRAASEDLPVIPSLAHRRSGDRPVIPPIVIPALASARRRHAEPSDGSLKVSAPVVLRGQGNPWRGPTSRFSVTPDESHSWNKPVVPDVARDIGEDASSGSSDTSSSGPSTPDDFTSLVVRFKRKSLDTDGESQSAEKRPKYVRKEWSCSGPSHRRTGSERTTSYSTVSLRA